MSEREKSTPLSSPAGGVELLSAYLPMDRRHTLAAGQALPDRVEGAALFADLAGFTPLTEAMSTALGARRGIEEVTSLLNGVYDVLIDQVHRYGGSVVGFNGDGMVCWFNRDGERCAIACALAMQTAMHPFAAVSMPDGTKVSPSMKAGVAAGPAGRFVVGDPGVQRLDLLAGETMNRMARAEGHARRGETVVAADTAERLGNLLGIAEWRDGFGVVAELATDVHPLPWPDLGPQTLTVEQVQPYLLPPVYERLRAGMGEFLAELRPATLLFLRFGGIAYDGDDEAGPKLDAYVCWLQGVLHHYDAYVLQLTTGDRGSYLYAAFGAPIAHEDDARRAVSAAFELQHPPGEFSFITGVQIGISQGPVRAGAYGSRARRTYGALGDEVNVAFRLMQAAPAGETRCTARVYQAAGERWLFEPLASVQVKGKSDPLPIYRPLGPARELPSMPAGTLVGRREELGVLARLLDGLADGRRVLLLEGEAGVGKSRLVEELASMTRERGITWLLGSGLSIEQQTPYRAWRDVLAALLKIDEQMSLAERRRQVQERVAEMPASLAERCPLLNDVFRLDLPESDLTRSFEPHMRHEGLVALVVELVRSKIEPLVLVLEDAQWLDSLSWKLALAAARSLEDSPLLLVLALRPLGEPPLDEYAALAGLAGAELLQLANMPPQEIEALAAARLGVARDDLPAEVAELVCDRAGGNPFFAEELVYALRDQGLVRVEPTKGDLPGRPRCVVSGDLVQARQTLPDTVEGVVLSRIDRLPPGEQLTLKVAAVIGRSFLFRTLRDVHPQQIVSELLQGHLAQLSQRDLTPLDALEPELCYIFKHIITQQVAYDTLLFAQRRTLHRLVAQWLETHTGERIGEYLGLIAWHYERAGENAKAADYLEQAAHHAFRLSAYHEAQEFLQRAIHLLQAPQAVPPEAAGPILLRLKARLGETAYTLGDYLEARCLLQEAVEESRQIDSPTASVLAVRVLGKVAIALGSFEEAGVLVQESLAMSRQIGDSWEIAKALRNLGLVAENMGELEKAVECYQESLALFQAVGDRIGQAGALANLGSIAALRGRHDEAVLLFEQAYDNFARVGFRWGAAYTLMRLGEIALEEQAYEQAQVRLTEALAICKEIGHRWGMTMSLIWLGNAACGMSCYSEAGELLCEALRMAQEIQLVPTMLCAIASIARLSRASGLLERAVGLYGLVQEHPSADLQDKEEARSVLGELVQQLPPQVYEAACARSAAMELSNVVAEILDSAG